MVTGAELVLFRPYRVVTRSWCGWWLTQGLDGRLGYMTSALYGVGEPLSLAEVREHAVLGGDVRPVEPSLDHEDELLRTALFDAGRLAVTTLARALWRCVGAVGVAGLVAGRSGSWEAHTLTSFALWGERVDPGRVHAGAADAMQQQVLEWTASEHRYVEVAETLAGLFSEVAMRHLSVHIHELAEDGIEVSLEPFDVASVMWKSVADRRLWPDAYEGFSVGGEWYRWLLSRAVGFEPSWFDVWVDPV